MDAVHRAYPLIDPDSSQPGRNDLPRDVAVVGLFLGIGDTFSTLSPSDRLFHEFIPTGKKASADGGESRRSFLGSDGSPDLHQPAAALHRLSNSFDRMAGDIGKVAVAVAVAVVKASSSGSCSSSGKTKWQ